MIASSISTRNTILHTIRDSKIFSEGWKGAGIALTLPYFYLDGYDYVWNIDADDIVLEGPAEYYLANVEFLLKMLKFPILSSDLYLSGSIQHWSFGVAFANRLVFKAMIESLINVSVSVP
ncbi:unnamed protein product, partial [Rotaria sp. Silwood1]